MHHLLKTKGLIINYNKTNHIIEETALFLKKLSYTIDFYYNYINIVIITNIFLFIGAKNGY